MVENHFHKRNAKQCFNSPRFIFLVVGAYGPNCTSLRESSQVFVLAAVVTAVAFVQYGEDVRMSF